MTFAGVLQGIYRAPSATAPMQAVDHIDAVAGVGLEGDRYADGAGTWSSPGRDHGQVTFIESEAVAAAADEAGMHVDPGETRRNLVTAGVPLNHLVGRRFVVGDVVFEGVKLCEPCGHLERVSGKPLRRPLLHRGGLNATIVVGGRIARGDPIRPL